LTKILSEDKLNLYSDKSIGIGVEEKNLSGMAAERGRLLRDPCQKRKRATSELRGEELRRIPALTDFKVTYVFHKAWVIWVVPRNHFAFVPYSRMERERFLLSEKITSNKEMF
jgi:hypothetical protein